jgi:hypothetical protein
MSCLSCDENGNGKHANLYRPNRSKTHVVDVGTTDTRRGDLESDVVSGKFIGLGGSALHNGAVLGSLEYGERGHRG